MKSLAIILTLLQFLFISNLCFSQSGVHGCYGFDCRQKKWFVSLSTGKSFLGPANDLEQAMKDSGFGDNHLDGSGLSGSHHTIQYPSHSSGLNWEMEVKHHINRRYSLLLSLGTSWVQTVTGNDEIGFNEQLQASWGNTLKLNCVARTVAVQYVFRTSNEGYDGLSIGPAITFHRVSENSSVENPYRHTSIRPGIRLGYTFSIINSKNWFIAGNLHYESFLNDKIGSIIVEPTSVYAMEPIEPSTFNGAKMHLQTLNLGITTGIRL